MARISWLTCILLVLLRLAIGWHFFFEGLHKIRSQNSAEKPFSSQGYFNEAEGPLGPRIREQLGDPDLLMKAKLQLADGATPTEKMPKPIAAEWDAYFERFASYYKLNDEKKNEAKARLDQAKADFVRWRTHVPSDKDDEKAIKQWKLLKVEAPYIDNMNNVESPQSIPNGVAQYEKNLARIHDIYTSINPELGRDVSKARLRELKADAAKMRNSFQKDIDEQTAKMKDALAKVLDPRLVGFEVGVPTNDPTYDDRVMSFLTLDPDAEDKMPKALAKQWDEYAVYVKDSGNPELRKDPTKDEAILKDLKREYVRYLQGLDEFTGQPAESDVEVRLKAYQAAIAKIKAAQIAYVANPTPENERKRDAARNAAASLRKGFVDDIKRFTDILKHDLGGFSDDNLKGIVEVEKPKNRFLWINWPTSNLDWLDTITPWTLFIAGGCLLAGLFTRLACIVAAGFLLVEYLSQAAFPWLPKSPMTEGNYLFVNKNVIELLALLALATTASGRWLGLDALLSRMWPFRRRTKKPEPPQAMAQRSPRDRDGVKESLFDVPPTRSGY